MPVAHRGGHAHNLAHHPAGADDTDRAHGYVRAADVAAGHEQVGDIAAVQAAVGDGIGLEVLVPGDGLEGLSGELAGIDAVRFMQVDAPGR